MKFFFKCLLSTFFAITLCNAAQAATSTCRDEAGPGGSPGNWIATYTFDNTAYGPLVNFTSLGFREDGSTLTRLYESYAGSSDKQWIFRWDGNANGLRGDTGTIVAATPGALLLPRLTTPNKRCSLQINPYAFSLAAGPRVAIVGDSLVASYTDTWGKRQNIANYTASAFGWRFHVDAVAARLFTSNTTDRVGGGGGMKEIMGVLATGPTAMVIALSTNDALSNAVAKDCSEGIHPYPPICQEPGYSWLARRQRTINFQLMLEDIAALAARQNVCVVFVTPQTDHVDATVRGYALASAPNYELEATRLRQYILDYVGLFSWWYPQARFGYMDWASVVTGKPYRVSDNLHMNGTGQLVHLSSWLNAVRSTCGI
jgi:lysophospholipase L1-like esterase